MASVTATEQTKSEPLVVQRSIVKKVEKRQGVAYYLQAGAFLKGADAAKMQQQLNTAGMDAFIRSAKVDGRQWHKVRIGPFYDSDTLYTAQTRLGRSGISYLVIKVES